MAFTCALLGPRVVRSEMLLDLSSGKGFAHHQTDPLWEVKSSYFHNRWVTTRVLDANRFPFTHYWIHNSKDSRWIAPSSPAFTQRNAPSGRSDVYFTYEVKFWLTKDETRTASIAGLNHHLARWASDNNGLRILLNSKQIWKGNTGREAYRKWQTLAPITKGFEAGWNTLEFVVRNNRQRDWNPTGFRIEAELFCASETPIPPITPPGPNPPGGGVHTLIATVPEPSAIVLVATGLGMFGLACWRRRVHAKRT